MDAHQILVYLDIVGVAFAGVTAILHLSGLDQTKVGKAVSSVSIDLLGAIKALRTKQPVGPE